MTATRTARLALGALGLGVLAYGGYGLLTSRLISDPAAVGKWLIGGLIGHDVLLAPVVFLLCAIAYRITDARWRGRLAALLLIGGSLVLISIPALLRQGRNRNPTVLPLDYARNLGLLLAVLVAAMALYGGIDAIRRRGLAAAHRRAALRAAAAATQADDECDEPDRSEESEEPEEPERPPEAEPESEPEPEPEPEATADDEPAAEIPADGEPGDEEEEVQDR